MFLYLTTDGLTIQKDGGKFILKNTEDKENPELLPQEVPISLIEGMVVFGRIQLTTDVIRTCLKLKIPVFFLSKQGSFFGKLDSLETRNVDLLYAHIKASLDPKISLNYAKNIIKAKIHNSAIMLQRRRRFYKRDDLNLLHTYDFFHKNVDKINLSENIEEVRGYEGICAREYFQAFSLFIDEPFSFKGRNRRPPKDPVNSMLSLGYTLLAQTIQMILNIQGIDPQIGFFHQPKDMKTLLVLDLMEMYRAWIIDDLVIRLLKTEKILISHFYINENNEQRPCLFLDDGLKIFLNAYYQTMFKEKASDISFGNNFIKLKMIEKNLELFKQSLFQETYQYEGFKIK